MALHEMVERLPGFIPEMVSLTQAVDTKPEEAGYALHILASFFRSAELEDESNYHNEHAPLFPKLIPALMTFIKNDKQVVDAIIVLYGIKVTARCSTPLPNLIPHLPSIFSSIEEAEGQIIPPITSAVGLIFLLSQTPSNILALMDDRVVTFLQYVRTNGVYSIHMDDLLEK